MEEQKEFTYKERVEKIMNNYNFNKKEKLQAIRNLYRNVLLKSFKYYDTLKFFNYNDLYNYFSIDIKKEEEYKKFINNLTYDELLFLMTYKHMIFYYDKEVSNFDNEKENKENKKIKLLKEDN